MIDNLLDSYADAQSRFKDIYALQDRVFKLIEGNPKYGNDIREAFQIVQIKDPNDPEKTKEVFNLPPDLPSISNQV